MMKSFLFFLLTFFLIAGKALALRIDLRVNGVDNVELTRSEAKEAIFSLELAPEGEGGQYAEWWVVAASPVGFWWFALDGSWRYASSPEDLRTSLRGHVPEEPVQATIPLANLKTQAIVLGDFYICVASDFLVDGRLSGEHLVYDCAKIHVVPDVSELPCASISGTWRGTLQGEECFRQGVYVQLFFVIEPSCEVIGPSGSPLQISPEESFYKVEIPDFLDGRCGLASFELQQISGNTLRVRVSLEQGGSLEGSLLKENP